MSAFFEDLALLFIRKSFPLFDEELPRTPGGGRARIFPELF